jgi:hypothetical protein
MLQTVRNCLRLGDSRARRPRTPGPTRSRFATQGPCHWPCGPRVPIGASRQAGLPRQCRRQLTGASPGLTGPQCRLTRALARVTALVRWRALRPRRRAAAMWRHCGRTAAARAASVRDLEAGPEPGAWASESGSDGPSWPLRAVLQQCATAARAAAQFVGDFRPVKG